MSDDLKNITIRVKPNFHQELKLYVTQKNTTFQKYILELIKKDMEQNRNVKNN